MYDNDLDKGVKVKIDTIGVTLDPTTFSLYINTSNTLLNTLILIPIEYNADSSLYIHSRYNMYINRVIKSRLSHLTIN